MNDRTSHRGGRGRAGGPAGRPLAAEHGFEGRLDVVCAESEAPYDRPPLSKRFLAGTAGTDDLTLRAPAFLDDRRISLVQDTHAVAVDRADASVALSSGGSLPYDRLILATRQHTPPPPGPRSAHPAVRVLRTVDDATRLRTKLQPGSRVVVIGAGFTGLEVAATARGLGCEVTVVEALDRVIARALSRPVSEHLLRLHRENGVRILFGRQVTALDGCPGGRRGGAAGRRDPTARGRRGRRVGVRRRPRSPRRPTGRRRRRGRGRAPAHRRPADPRHRRLRRFPDRRYGSLRWSPCRTRPTRASTWPRS
nr:NAD(P)/FAD-dependent oxidoreductase [Actinospica acidiphila]